jgi:Uma2 family endonuclease
MATVESKFISAAEFLLLSNELGAAELVKGKVQAMSPPGWRHGNIASRITQYLANYLDKNKIGRIATLDAGIITQRNPDTVRGADVAFHSFQRLPKNIAPDNYPEHSPEIVWEVLSPNDRWKDVLGKVSEYLTAGVLVVCVIDIKNECCITYFPDKPDERLSRAQTWSIAEILPGFEINLEKLFEV